MDTLSGNVLWSYHASLNGTIQVGDRISIMVLGQGGNRPVHHVALPLVRIDANRFAIAHGHEVVLIGVLVKNEAIRISCLSNTVVTLSSQ